MLYFKSLYGSTTTTNLFEKVCFLHLSCFSIIERLDQQLYLLFFINDLFFLHFIIALLAIFIIYLLLLAQAIFFLLNFLDFHRLSFAFSHSFSVHHLEASDFAFRYILYYASILKAIHVLFSIFPIAFSSMPLTFAVLENFEAHFFVFAFVKNNLLDQMLIYCFILKLKKISTSSFIHFLHLIILNRFYSFPINDTNIGISSLRKWSHIMICRRKFRKSLLLYPRPLHLFRSILRDGSLWDLLINVLWLTVSHWHFLLIVLGNISWNLILHLRLIWVILLALIILRRWLLPHLLWWRNLIWMASIRLILS